jgi:hypothetical protein
MVLASRIARRAESRRFCPLLGLWGAGVTLGFIAKSPSQFGGALTHRFE